MVKKNNRKESPYDPKFVEKIKRSEQQIAEGKCVRVTDVDEFIANLTDEPVTVPEVTREDIDKIRELSHRRLAERLKDDEIVDAVTERFMQNRKGEGELTETELLLLNSQINASRCLASRLDDD